MTLLQTLTVSLIEADGVASPDMADALYDDYELRARYVMEALREFKPTDKMVSYGYCEVTTKIETDSRDIPDVWKAMFIAAEEEANA